MRGEVMLWLSDFLLYCGPAQWGHDEAYRVEEEQQDENNEMSSTTSLVVLKRAQHRRIVPLTLVISLREKYLDYTSLEFRVGSKISYE